MAPICGPWSQMNNINDQEALAAKRRKYLPMLEFCVQVAIFQIEHGGHFIIENPAHRHFGILNVSKGYSDIPEFRMEPSTCAHLE